MSPSIVPNSGPPHMPSVGATPVASASFSARPCIAATPPSMCITPHEYEKQPATPSLPMPALRITCRATVATRSITSAGLPCIVHTRCPSLHSTSAMIEPLFVLTKVIVLTLWNSSPSAEPIATPSIASFAKSLALRSLMPLVPYWHKPPPETIVGRSAGLRTAP